MSEESRKERIKRIREGVNKANENVSLELGKLPPQSLDMEEAVLGALLLEGDSIHRVIGTLKPEHFYKEAHSHIFKAIVFLLKHGSPIDILTVKEQLKKDGQLEMCGGVMFLNGLTNKVGFAGNIETHALHIVQKFMHRELIRVSSLSVQNGYDETKDIFDLLSEASLSINKIIGENVKSDVSVARDLIGEMLQNIEDRLKDKVSGVPSSIVSLRNKLGYFAEGDMIVVGGSTSMGKTAYIDSEATYWIREGRSVAIFSLEMSKIQMMYRFISQISGVDLETLAKRKPSDDNLKMIHVAIGQIENAKLFIDDTPAISVQELRAKCHKLNDKHKLGAIFIDYLQLVTLTERPKGMSREQELSEISRSTKRLAKEIRCPVFALVQLSREVARRKDNGFRPILSDIRESGSIEQDADVVLFPYRPEYYGIKDFTDDYAEMIVAKNRNGSLGSCKMKFTGHLAKYSTWTDNGTVESFIDAKNQYDTPELDLGITKSNDAPF